MRLERLNAMESYILEEGTVSLENMKKHFSMSTNTIRRDINELIVRGHVRKVYGGVAANTYDVPIPLSVRASKHQSEKKIIGELAASFVEDGDMIFLDSGSSVLYMIPHLKDRKNVTIVTHNLNAMVEASKFPNLRLVSLGGMYTHATSSFTGITTMEELNRYNFAKIFIAATGVTIEKGLTNTTFVEAEIKRRVVEYSSKVILMADHSKFGFASTISFFPFEALYAVVTDRRPPAEFMKEIRNSNIMLLYDKKAAKNGEQEVF